MHDLTARRLRRLVHIMAVRSPNRMPCRPGSLLEEVITDLPNDERDRGDERPQLFRELIEATNALEERGVLLKDESGWSLTPSGLRAATTAAADVPPEGTKTQDPGHGMYVRAARVLSTDAPDAHGAPESEQQPRSVGLAGSFTVPDDVARTRPGPWAVAERAAWAPDDPSLRMTYDEGAGIWAVTLLLARGHYEFKVVLDDSWSENYGARGMRCGPNLSLDLGAPKPVTFLFDHGTKLLSIS